MPTCEEILVSPSELGTLSGIYGRASCMSTKSAVDEPETSDMEVEESAEVEAELNEKKRKKSILEMLDMNANNGVGGDKTTHSCTSTQRKENSKLVVSDEGAFGRKLQMGPRKKTIRDFYSLSPKQEAESGTPGSANVTPKKKKRTTGKFIALNDNANPIHVHIPFSGQEKNSLIIIAAHCVERKFDLGDEPLVLAGKYHCRSKVHIQRFLTGFGRFCM
mmetsp:Transcript_32353/g.68409  ORF Transcript_32353/g.68409 Transcript_32353/m.68409 type:complete len:219 (-) Transcript_32353:110-766(-)|eukprot:CAMPEP_0183720222 /NCGR_PEP_ID=MMETSP0737-20130205/12904_1 /TAXON_ID=385413 /ORGANISM="Thalassiosira miniscula, Strain CCMP1093" /LENGTH=218 /DNA_ID=CAMNT_0025950061 /DNA_START=51 /DNA_END=707 /DNA_ORIENTATION=-